MFFVGNYDSASLCPFLPTDHRLIAYLAIFQSLPAALLTPSYLLNWPFVICKLHSLIFFFSLFKIKPLPSHGFFSHRSLSSHLQLFISTSFKKLYYFLQHTNTESRAKPITPSKRATVSSSPISQLFSLYVFIETAETVIV